MAGIYYAVGANSYVVSWERVAAPCHLDSSVAVTRKTLRIGALSVLLKLVK